MSDDYMGLKVCGGIVTCIGITLLCVLLPLAYSVVELNEYALYRSTFSEKLYYDPDYSESGRHYTGVQGELIKFPRTKNLIEFKEGYSGKPDGILQGGGNALQAWTIEGANVYIEASYYFSLNKEKLLAMYTEYGDDWKSFLVRLSFGVLKETTVTFKTADFVSRSSIIAQKMKDNLAASFTTNFGGAVTLDGFYLQKISFDDSIDDAINNKLIQAYKKKSFEFQKTINVTTVQTQKLVNDITNQIQVINATQTDAPAVTARYTQIGTKLGTLVTAMTAAYTQMVTPVTTFGDLATGLRLMYISELRVDNRVNKVVFVDNGVTKTLPNPN